MYIRRLSFEKKEKKEKKNTLQVFNKLIVIITCLPSYIWVKSNGIVGNAFPHSGFYT